jgi:hypothetical protein
VRWLLYLGNQKWFHSHGQCLGRSVFTQEPDSSASIPKEETQWRSVFHASAFMKLAVNIILASSESMRERIIQRLIIIRYGSQGTTNLPVKHKVNFTAKEELYELF